MRDPVVELVETSHRSSLLPPTPLPTCSSAGLGAAFVIVRGIRFVIPANAGISELHGEGPAWISTRSICSFVIPANAGISRLLWTKSLVVGDLDKLDQRQARSASDVGVCE